jgi:Flp pilus assembly pilin Flp
MRKIFKTLLGFTKDTEAATAVEYAVLLTLISAVIIASVAFLGGNTRQAYKKLNTELSNVAQTEEAKDKCGDKDSEYDPDCGRGND